MENFAMKITSKILVLRLTPLLPTLVSAKQGAFIKGRDITENIHPAQELMFDINAGKMNDENIIIKLDIAKVFDRVEWIFLEKVLQAYSFNQNFAELIMLQVRGTWFTVSMGVLKVGFFTSSGGLHQGNPLSPFPFILMEEAISRYIMTETDGGHIRHFSIHGRATAPTHLLCTDDILFFTKCRENTLQNAQLAMRKYERISG